MMQFKSQVVSRVILVGFLLLLIGVGAVPAYLTGHWSWSEPPPVLNLRQIKEVREQGVSVPGWETLSQNQVQISKYILSVQEIQRDQQRGLILLLPQNGPQDQPH